MTTLYTTDFEDGTLSAKAPGFTDMWFGGITISNTSPVSGSKSLKADAGDYHAAYTALAAQTVQRVQVSLKDHGIGAIWTRVGGSGTNWNGYHWSFESYRDGTTTTTVYCDKHSGDRPLYQNDNVLSTSVNFQFPAPGTEVIVEALSNGNVHELRFWVQGQTRPASPMATFTDSTLASGYPALGGRTNGATYFDNFVYYDAVPTLSAPAAPTNVVAVAGNAFASVSFAAPIDNGGSPITGYTVTASTGQTATGTASPIVVSGLANGVAVTFTVKATNAQGQSPASAASNSVTSTAPPVGSTAPNAPSNVVATPGNGNVSVAFVAPASDGGAPITSYTVTASTGQTQSGTASPIVITVPNGIFATYTVKAVNANGPSPASSPSASVAPTSPGDSVTQQGGINIATFGIGPGKTYATVDAFTQAFGGVDLVATNQMIIGEVYADNLVTTTLYAANSDASHYIWLRPAANLGFANYYGATVAQNYGTQGIELTCKNDNYNAFRVGKGGKVTGFRINIQQGVAENGSLRIQDGVGAFPPTLIGNRILNNGTDGMIQYAYVSSVVTDNLIIRTAACGGRIFRNDWKCTFDRNTVVLAAGATASQAIYNEYGGSYRSNAFYGFSQPLTHGADVDNCYTNIAPTTAISGLIVDTANPFFVNATNDFRPGSALLGKGGTASTSINDNIGSNRGVSPDVGAFQLNPAVPLPQGVCLQQYMDGATFVISGTTTNAPVSGKVSLTPDSPANGAQSVGPLDLVLASGVFSIAIDDVVPGNYLVTVTLTNAGGTSPVTGTSSFNVIGMGNLVYDTGGVGTGGGGTDPVLTLPAPTIALNTAPANIMAGKVATVSGSVNLNGDSAGHVDVFLDPQPSGAAMSLGAANVLNSTWTKQADLPPGLYRIRVVATSNAQTASAASGDIRVLNLTGNFTLPTA